MNRFKIEEKSIKKDIRTIREKNIDVFFKLVRGKQKGEFLVVPIENFILKYKQGYSDCERFSKKIILKREFVDFVSFLEEVPSCRIRSNIRISINKKGAKYLSQNLRFSETWLNSEFISLSTDLTDYNFFEDESSAKLFAEISV